MLGIIKTTVAAAALATLPMMASAVTLSPTNNIADGDVGIDIADGPFFFGADFFAGDTADTFSFNFANNSDTAVTVATVVGSVLQFTAMFSDGLEVGFASGSSVSIPGGSTEVFTLSSVLAANSSDTLTVSFTDVNGGSGRANLDLSIQAVPVPAAGLLLLAGLGGIGAMRRRKKA